MIATIGAPRRSMASCDRCSSSAALFACCCCNKHLTAAAGLLFADASDCCAPSFFAYAWRPRNQLRLSGSSCFQNQGQRHRRCFFFAPVFQAAHCCRSDERACHAPGSVAQVPVLSHSAARWCAV